MRVWLFGRGLRDGLHNKLHERRLCPGRHLQAKVLRQVLSGSPRHSCVFRLRHVLRGCFPFRGSRAHVDRDLPLTGGDGSVHHGSRKQRVDLDVARRGDHYTFDLHVWPGDGASVLDARRLETCPRTRRLCRRRGRGLFGVQYRVAEVVVWRTELVGIFAREPDHFDLGMLPGLRWRNRHASDRRWLGHHPRRMVAATVCASGMQRPVRGRLRHVVSVSKGLQPERRLPRHLVGRHHRTVRRSNAAHTE
mmetsp:Transcript_77495/g.207839  ORF Transcript_77495/g.207839 Transcript_77495/m.207839 type:complete len:249 (-) Transcript_77495:454-1200(-)